MSYSFSVTGEDRRAAIQAAGAELDKTVASQGEHVNDQDAALRTIRDVTGLLGPVPAGHLIAIIASGSIQVTGDGVQSVTVNASAYFMKPTPPTPV